MIRRREFIAGLGSAAACPVLARAQQAAMPVIGYLGLGSARDASAGLTSFRQGLGEVGYVEGQNVTVEYRWAEGEYGRMPAFAAEFVRRSVAVIFASNTTPALAAKRATSTIPIVFNLGGGDPIALGFVESLSRPGGNATGVMQLSTALETKVLELLRELVPNADNVAALMNPSNPTFQRKLQDLQQAARSIRLGLNVLQASTAPQIDEAFTMLAQQRTNALIVAADTFLNVRRYQITTLAAHYRIPAIYQTPVFVEADGLMSYAASGTDLTRRAGIYVGRILKGEKPADLPVVQPTKFEMVVNLKTAKALGLTIPETLLATADKVIE
jgi:putative ABC transport system substrate-binding protein